MSKGSKYCWVDIDMDKWIKKEHKRMEEAGMSVKMSTITKIVHDRVLVPNNIRITDLIKPKVKLKKGWKHMR